MPKPQDIYGCKLWLIIYNNFQVRSLSKCQNEGCYKVFNRDYVGALNIAANLRFFLEYNRWHPAFKVLINVCFSKSFSVEG